MSAANGWRLNQPKVTLLASAFFVEWSLPTFTSASNNKQQQEHAQHSNTNPPFVPEASSLNFTCEWKAASSLDSTKLEFKGDVTCCLVPIEWAEEDVVLRLSYRFNESILLPDGSRAPTNTIFDGERCVVRARRAPPMPLLMPLSSSTTKMANANFVNKNHHIGATTAQILKGHPGLVDAFSLCLLRRGNDVSQLACGPWLGSMKLLMHELGIDGGGEDEKENEDEETKSNASSSGSSSSSSDSYSSSTSPSQSPSSKLLQKFLKGEAKGVFDHELPGISKKYQGCASLNGIKMDVWEVTYKRTATSAIDFSFFTNEHENSLSPRQQQINRERSRSVASPELGSTTTTTAVSAFDSSSPTASLFLSSAKNASFSAFPSYHEQVEKGASSSSSPQVKSSSAPPPPIQESEQDASYDQEDVIVFLAAHDGLDEVNMFDNRKLTDRLNPLNITKAFVEEWMPRPNVMVCVCGSFSFGQFAVHAAEQLFREYDLQKRNLANKGLHQFSKPRVVCCTFASNPPRLSQADTTGRLKRKDNLVIRSQNHFLHICPIIEAPIVAPDDLPNVEAAANARRSRSLDFVDYFLGETASFAVGKEFLSIVLESYLERQNAYDQHSVLMTAQGTAEVVNPILTMASVMGQAASTLSGGNKNNNNDGDDVMLNNGSGNNNNNNNEDGGDNSSSNFGFNSNTAVSNDPVMAAACESPLIRSVIDETASSSGFTPMDIVSNLPELVRERILIGKGLPDNLSSVLHANSLLSAFESSLQQHLVAATCNETLAEAALRCEPVITSVVIRPTRLRMAELSLIIQGTNLQFARHVVLRDSATPRDNVFAKSEVEVHIRERTRGFDGFACKVHPASLLRFAEEIEEEVFVPPPTATNASSSQQKLSSTKNMFASSDDLTSSSAETLPPSNSNNILQQEEPLSPASRSAAQGATHKRKKIVAKFDVCVWAENGCAAYINVTTPFPDGLVPWLQNSGSWISKQNNFLSPPVELISSAARLHLWGSFASSMFMGGSILPGTDLPRRLLKSLESASLSLAAVNPQQASSNFFTRALKSAKDKFSSDPLTMSNAPAVPANLKLTATEALLKDIPPAPPTPSLAAAASRARILHQQTTETRELKKFLDPLMQNMSWLNNGVDYRSKVLRAAHLFGIPLESSWFYSGNNNNNSNSTNQPSADSGSARSSAPAANSGSGNGTPLGGSTSNFAGSLSSGHVPVVEALLWNSVVSLLTAAGTRIQDSITEITLKSFCEGIGYVILRHESFAGKKESDGPAFFAEMMQIWVVCLMHELRSLACGTTLVIVTGERHSGTSSIVAALQNSSSAFRNTSIPHSFTWIVDLYPIPDLFGEALLLFPNVALFFVTTLSECSIDNSEVLNLSATTNSLILSQRHDVDSTSWNRHHQWVIVNKIDTVVIDKQHETDPAYSHLRTNSEKRMKFIREEFKKVCSVALKQWEAFQEKNLLVMAINPIVQPMPTTAFPIGALEGGDLRIKAQEILKEAVQRICLF